MGKNKLAKFADMEQMACVHQYPPSAIVGNTCPLKGNWNRDAFARPAPIVLELGCGKGEYAVGLAREQPGRNYIGIDIKGARMWTGARQATELSLGNCAFLRTDISLLPLFFAPGEVDEIWVTFPDPQMKKPRKRLTGTRMLSLYRQVLRPGGLVRLKTDSPFLYLYTMALLRHNDLTPVAATDDLYAPGCPVDIPLIKTYYERQWLSRGMKIKYVAFAIPDHDLSEPDDDIPLDDYRSITRAPCTSNP